MEIRGREGDSHLRFTTVELGHENLPSLRAHAELRIGHFSAATDTVWFEASALDTFIAELRRLEATRRGAATLSAMSPGDCDLRVETLDRSGHVRLRVELQSMRYVGGEPLPSVLAGAFEVDAELLAGMPGQLEDLKRLPSE